MRVMLTAELDLETFNAAVRDGTSGEKLNRILESQKPEAVYFTARDGKRTAVLIIDLPDASGIPALAEPWFLTFNAKLHVDIVMLPEDLGNAGLEELGKKWGG